MIFLFINQLYLYSQKKIISLGKNNSQYKKKLSRQPILMFGTSLADSWYCLFRSVQACLVCIVNQWS